jgi:hypothetical protein
MEGEMVWEKVFIYSTQPPRSCSGEVGMGRPVEAQLAVVVVLDDVPAGVLRPAQQGLPPAMGVTRPVG